MINDVQLLIHCPACGKEFSQDRLKVVGNKGSTLLVHASCSDCQGHSLSLVSRNPENNRQVAMGMVTDLQEKEAAQMMKKEPLSADEALDIYQKA